MLRSLFAGVSGLRNHLVKLDVIGNNIANVNTVGFKAGRVTFKDTMAQLLQGASRPVGDLGGINPMQLGTGMSVASIDTIMSQGGLESTGNITDLAIQGEGYFIVSDGATRYYTRAGAFQFDANGKLVSPNNGFAVQGQMADINGVISTGTPVTDIVLPFGQSSSAKATSQLSLIGNLNSDSVKGTILDSSAVYGLEVSGDDTDLNGLYAYGTTNEVISGLVHNESYVEVSVDGGTTTKKYYYNEDPDDPSALTPADGDGIFKSLDDLVALIDADFNGNVGAALVNGQIVFTAESDNQNLVVSSSNTNLNRALQQANNSDLDTGDTALTDTFMHKAKSTDLLVNLRNSSGESLELAATDEISINAKVGGTAITEATLTVGATSTYQDLIDLMTTSLGIINENGVTIDANDGSIIIHADGGTANEITQLDVVAKTAAGISRTTFDQIFSLNSGTWNVLQQAENGTHQASLTYYDSLGNANTLTFTFTQDDSTSNRWFWEASVDSPATIISGGSGIVLFNDDGSLKEFVYNNSATELKINPNNGANSPITIDIDAGNYSNFDGITQGASPSTLVATDQDGYPMGALDKISISKTGKITGIYTNGVTKTLAQIVLAAFTNPSGLLKAGDNMYMASDNSGIPIQGIAGTGINSIITPGALEMSNVDLATEFTNMIIAQRGFQANARVITTSDDLLTELVNLKR